MHVVFLSGERTGNDDPLFVARAASKSTESPAITTVRARTVLLATGVVNRRPDVPDDVHDAALQRGLLRYCPICDAFEVTDRAICLIGTGSHGLSEATFLRAYSSRVTLVAPHGVHDLDDSGRAHAEINGKEVLDGPWGNFELQDEAITLTCISGHHQFDTIICSTGNRHSLRTCAEP